MADPNSNGLTIGKLGNYMSPVVTANAALVAVKMSDREAEAVFQKATHPNRDRSRYNLWARIVHVAGLLLVPGPPPQPSGGGISDVLVLVRGVRI